MRSTSPIIAGAILATVWAAGSGFSRRPATWTAVEVQEIRDLGLGHLGPLPADPTNPVADEARAVSLGHRLFFDTRFSGNGRVACATCHDPARDFQDGTPLGHGIGTTGRRTPSIVSSARAPWFFWDGRKDSQWSQALGPWESAVEHGGNRGRYAHLVAQHYRAEYEALFGPLPELRNVPADAGPVPDSAANRAWVGASPESRVAINRVFANLGKAVAAYERRLEYGPGRFDAYASALGQDGRAPSGILTGDEEAGLRLFIGKARCTACHSGPLFTDQQFHAIGVPDPAAAVDSGRSRGVRQALADEFNCRGQYSAAPRQCAELDFAVTEGPELVAAFKTPSLRNVALRAPYMHAGQFTTLETVVDHYNRAPAASAGRSELLPLELSAREQRQLVAFLRALTAPLATPDSLLRPAR